tara:strand:+ start:409 stop:612 length:204 start_codon:yes stop_codon:yes gene_type:complete
MIKTFKLDGKEYSVDILSESGKRIVSGLQEIETEIKEKTNLIAIFNKAKNAYIAEIKSEILSQKAGL